MKIRVKFGKTPYGNNFTCAFCGRSFDTNGFYMRLEYCGKVVDIPICSQCFETGDLFEGMIDLSRHHASHPIGLA